MRAVALILSAALLAGCGGAVTPLVSGSKLSPAALGRAGGDTSKATLLYVANASGSGGDDVYVYSLPGGKLVQTLWGLPGIGDLCTDIADDVFVPMGDSLAIREYRHGGKNPIETLADPKGSATDCSVDPTTGDLAVANDCTPSTCNHGNVAIYAAARGKPKYYTPESLTNEYYCAYDNLGDLFVAGTAMNAFALAELPKQGKRFAAVSIGQYIRFAGGVKWDGKHLAIADQFAEVIYQFNIRGGVGKRVGTTRLDGMKHIEGYSIENGTVYAADANGPDVAFYHYPAGGKPFKKLYGFDIPISTAVSLGK